MSPLERLRTPEARFENLPGYPFAPHYFENLPGYEGLRMHHLDEGPRDAKVTFLCLHGQPTWSYLYRHMVPVFAKAGHRVVAPDWFGFGKSDKPLEERVYTFDFHRESLLRLIEALALENICLVCQDWGGLLGLTVPMDMPERFTRLLVMNTALATGEAAVSDPRSRAAFLIWKTYSRLNPDLKVGALVRFSEPQLSALEAAAYDAPFPDARYKSGVRRFPQIVPTTPDAPGAALSRRAAQFWQVLWYGESFMAVGLRDAILGPGPMAHLRAQIRGCPPPLEVDAGHFVQEKGEVIARAALAHFGLN